MTINCKGNLIDLSSPKVMGILNITPCYPEMKPRKRELCASYSHEVELTRA